MLYHKQQLRTYYCVQRGNIHLKLQCNVTEDWHTFKSVFNSENIPPCYNSIAASHFGEAICIADFTL